MSALPANIESAVDEAVSQLISRISDDRGLTSEILKPRILAALEKYLFKSEPNADKNAVRSFIEDIRADDLCLIIACERGDEKAWEDLVANYDPTVRSAARKMTSNSEDAEDLAGSIWAELYGLRQDAEGNRKSKLSYYSGRGSLAGWLRAVVSQLAVDEYRKQSRFVQIEEDRSFENLAEDAANNSNHSQVVHTDSNPEDIFTEKSTSEDVSAALRKAITELESEDRLVLKMYYFDDLKLKDIAAAFGYHEATASRKLVRVQAEIRKSVEKQLMGVHGWSSDEVKRSLSDAAAKLGISLETALGAWAAALLVQDIWR
ncbi:RNA polymerase sigma factor [Leptolyngbya sp. 7M]|uniref:RNA polymerase sigma factor n=1 Tax=Leptolyngbya sp. 7M TaxID=2812896 RepID=UPI001B8D4168|nr:sigma-70 family RNA polymerase sigma factor [Leptolyngbya sp. 7M]QYO67373.1 sigma-70 family RNA polymerase sigma factor [Leptolyngbya sp. 7M]